MVNDGTFQKTQEEVTYTTKREGTKKWLDRKRMLLECMFNRVHISNFVKRYK